MASSLSLRPVGPEPPRYGTPTRQQWELYNIDEDFSQANDLARANPEKLRQLQDLWWVEAAKYNVLPLDWRVSDTLERRGDGPAEPDRRAEDDGPTFRAWSRLPDAASPPMLNKSWTITADIEVPEASANGMIVTHGGLEGGYGLYLRDGKPTFVYNYLSLERPTFAANEPLPKGKAKLVVDFAYDGGGMGKGGSITMTANGKKIAEGRLERTVPVQFSLGRRAGRRHGCRLGGRLHLRAAVRLHRHDREGHGRAQISRTGRHLPRGAATNSHLLGGAAPFAAPLPQARR